MVSVLFFYRNVWLLCTKVASPLSTSYVPNKNSNLATVGLIYYAALFLCYFDVDRKNSELDVQNCQIAAIMTVKLTK